MRFREQPAGVRGEGLVGRSDDFVVVFATRALREGSQHSAKETPYTLERVLPLARALTSMPILLRMDSGFDSAELYVVATGFRGTGGDNA